MRGGSRSLAPSTRSASPPHLRAPRKAARSPTFADEAALPAPYGDYARAVRIIDCGGGCSGVAKADLRQITITVTYRPMTGVGVAGIAKAAVITTFIAKR